MASTLQYPWTAAAANVQALSERLGTAPLAVLPWSESAAADHRVLAKAALALRS